MECARDRTTESLAISKPRRVLCGFLVNTKVAEVAIFAHNSLSDSAAAMLCGLFSGRRLRRREDVEPPPEEPLLYAGAEQETSELTTFAVETSSTSREFLPFFGPYAGRRVRFQIDERRTRVFVDGVGIVTQIDLSRGSGSVKDRCITFLHSSKQYNLPPPQPHSLHFVCKQQILLSGVLPPGTPLREARMFDSTAKQAVVVRVWPSSVLAGQRVTPVVECGELKIRVLARLSFGELGWFVREKLGLPTRTTRSVHFIEPGEIYRLQPNRPLKTSHTQLDCFVSLRPLCPTSTSLSRRLPVMMVGRGMREVEVTPCSTVGELDAAIRDLFGVGQHCFIYIPALFSWQDSHASSLKMFADANRPEAMTLLDRHARQFPMVSENNSSFKVADYRGLYLYKLTLADVGLLNEEMPLLSFDVTGPTVPLSFRAFSMIGSSSSGRNSGENYMRVSVDTRIVSVNPHWKASTLMKYVDCVSRAHCTKLIQGNTVVPEKQVIGKLFSREWVVTHPSGRKTVSPNVLRVI